MTSDRDLDTKMSAWLDERAQSRAPNGLLERTVERTSNTKPRPVWRIPEWWRRRLTRPFPGATGRINTMTGYKPLAAAVAALAIGTSLAVSGSLGVFDASGGTVHTVNAAGAGAELRSIAAAVDAAEAGDTIVLRPGVYEESVIIDKDIVIRGEGDDRAAVIVRITDAAAMADTGNDAIDDGDWHYAFLLDGVDAVLSNLTIEGGFLNTSAVLVDGGSPTIEGLRVDLGGGSDIRRFLLVGGGATGSVVGTVADGANIVTDGATPAVTGNTVDATIEARGEGAAPLISGNRASGFGARFGASPRIENNVVEDRGHLWECGILVSREGVSAEGIRATAEVIGNTIEVGDDGICVWFEGDATVSDNVISGIDAAIVIAGQSNVLVTGNQLSDNETAISVEADEDGIGANAAMISGNEITDNVVGLDLQVATPVVEGNVFCGNVTDFELAEGTEPDIRTNSGCEALPVASAG
jgi:parallel beta-helix repeat protein